eukprot:11204349-Lingulodinium_polyedra.AAC.1
MAVRPQVWQTRFICCQCGVFGRQATLIMHGRNHLMHALFFARSCPSRFRCSRFGKRHLAISGTDSS